MLTARYGLHNCTLGLCDCRKDPRSVYCSWRIHLYLGLAQPCISMVTVHDRLHYCLYCRSIGCRTYCGPVWLPPDLRVFCSWCYMIIRITPGAMLRIIVCVLMLPLTHACHAVEPVSCISHGNGGVLAKHSIACTIQYNARCTAVTAYISRIRLLRTESNR